MIFLDYKNDKPLHEQIRLGIKNLIMTGSLSKDEQLPSVRELSISLTVNPNTVQRAYKDLEKEGASNTEQALARARMNRALIRKNVASYK